MTKLEVIKEIENITGHKLANVQFYKMSQLINKLTASKIVYRDRYLYNDSDTIKVFDIVEEAKKITDMNNITLDELRGKRRFAHYVSARVHFCRYLKKQYNHVTTALLAKFLNCDHTTITHYLYYYKGYCKISALKPCEYVYE